MSVGPISHRPRVRTGTIVCDSVGTFPYGGPQPLDTDYCERLGKRLLNLFSASIDGRLAAESDSITELQRLVNDRTLPVQRLLNFVYLMERSVLDELALDSEIGATSVRWLIVSQAVRKASFDLMAAYFDRAQHEATSPTITDKLTTLYSRAMMD